MNLFTISTDLAVAARRTRAAAPRAWSASRIGGPLIALALLLLPRDSAAQSVDSTLARIEQLTTAGDRAGARALADSLLATLPDSAPRYPDALYWRAFASSNAADAERDYLKLIIEYPVSPRAPEALLALAQLEYARGDRTAARRRFDRLLREYPAGPHVARASFWSARLALDEGDRPAACNALAVARRAVSASDVELVNQIDYYAAQCAVAPADSTARPGDAPPDSAGRTGVPDVEYSVQVAAFSTRREAASMVTRLRQRGFDVRLAGTRAPYRVRIGRYATREEAAAALERMRRSRVSGIIVEAEPR
jgi:cell division septation protein DedD